MPHIIIEYSKELEKTGDINAVMLTAHKAAFASGLFGESDIKIRAFPTDHILIAGKAAKAISIVVKLLSGRDAATKKALTQSVHDAILALNTGVASLSVEACDMERESYSKSSA